MIGVMIRAENLARICSPVDWTEKANTFIISVENRM
jgi:hypothetical protein